MVATTFAAFAAPSPADVIAVRPAHECCVWLVSPEGYPHAHAFDDCAVALAEGLAEALGAAPGAVEVVRDPAEIGDRAPVVLGANLLTGAAARELPAASVIVNLEQLDGASRWFGDDYRTLLAHHAVVDYSAGNTAALHRLGLRHVRHLPLGASPGLQTLPDRRSDHVDVCFYGSINARRAALLDELERRGLIVERLFGVYGNERDAAIARAKVVLNVHFYDAAIFEAVRVTHLLANGVCVVTEGDARDPDLTPLAPGLVVAPYDALADRCEELVGDPAARSALAVAGKAVLADRPQADGWRRVLEGTGADRPPVTAVPAQAAPAAVRTVSVLAPGDDAERCRSLAVAASELRSLGVDVRAAVIDRPDQVGRVGWECTVTNGRALADLDPLEDFTHADDHLVLTVDRLGAMLLPLAPLRRVLWWLSVDDLVGPGGPLADPALLSALADDDGIDHRHHGAYVREFLRSRGVGARRLDDHLAATATRDPAAAGVVVGPSGPAADRLAAALAPLGAEVLSDIAGGPAATLAACAVYVHAGPLPGRDAVLRLAVALGATVFVPEAGAGRYMEDLPVPDGYRYDETGDPGDLIDRIRLASAVPARAHRAMASFRWAVADERGDMIRQLERLVDPTR